MVSASEIRVGQIIKLKGALWKVIEAEVKARTAQFSSHTYIKLQNLKTFHTMELRVSPEEKFEDVEVEQIEMDYLYTDGKNFYFMHPETYEQFEIPSSMIGEFKDFLKEGMKVKIEVYEGNPIGVVIPESVELKVVSTGSGIRGDSDATWKSATLENGMEILVPQFIKEGDIVKVSPRTKEYIERVSK
ncbi:MAG: elongation factor P [Candidatus Omnitrophota bacterium]|nr:MAG: elongation factor P [Candidatus Omnitrophota bacterium]